MISATKRSRHPSSSEQLTIGSDINTITAIEAIPGNKQAQRLYLDGLPWLTTAERVVRALNLHAGERYGAGPLRERIVAAEKSLAMQLALQLLSYRARGKHEIVTRLKKRRLSDEAIAAVIEGLEQADYINDGAFVADWIRDRIEGRGYGRNRIKSELLAKGIEPAIIQKELARAYPEDQEERLALKLAETKLATYDHLDEQTKNRRLAQMLMRRGFSASLAFTVARGIVAQS